MAFDLPQRFTVEWHRMSPPFGWRRDIAEQALAEGHARGQAEGQAQGRAEGQARAILKILVQRKVQVSEEQQRRILACADLVTLDRWLDQAFSVASPDELVR